VADYPTGKIKAHAFNPTTLDTILKVLELKYDLDEQIQAEKSHLIDILLRLNNRRLTEAFVYKLGRDDAALI